MAQKYGALQPLLWSVILEEKTDQDILSAHLALTVLLLEAAYADGDCSGEEKEHFVTTLVTNFGISMQEIDTLLADRDKENREYVDHFAHKFAKLLGLSHSELIDAKLWARKQLS